MSAGIEVVLLDVGGVIVPPADPLRLAHAAAQLGLSPAEFVALLYEGEPWYTLSTGRSDEAAYWQTLGARVGWPEANLRRLLEPVWERDTMDDDVVALVQALRGRTRLAILSNATLRLEDHLRRLGIAQFFTPIINSARVGLRKPDPRIFSLALALLGVEPAAVLFVDDKQRNVEVAREMGMATVLFDRASTLAAALTTAGLLPCAPDMS